MDAKKEKKISFPHYSPCLKKTIKKKLLSKKQEISLAKKKDKGDQSARNKLIESNIRLVINIAKKYSKFGYGIDDIISEGLLGLVQGIDRYDWTKGCRVSTYITYWIHQAILKFMNSNNSLKISSNAKILKMKADTIKDEHFSLFGANISEEELCQELNISLKHGQKFKVAEDINFIEVDAIKDVHSGSNENDLNAKIYSLEIGETLNSIVENLDEKEKRIFTLRCI